MNLNFTGQFLASLGPCQVCLWHNFQCPCQGLVLLSLNRLETAHLIALGKATLQWSWLAKDMVFALTFPKNRPLWQRTIFLGRSWSSGLTGLTFSSMIYVENKQINSPIKLCDLVSHLPLDNCNCRSCLASVIAAAGLQVGLATTEAGIGSFEGPNLECPYGQACFLHHHWYFLTALAQPECSDFH